MKHVALLVVLLAAATPAQTSPIVVAGATLVNSHGSDPVSDAVIVVEGETIRAVGRASEIRVPDGATVVRADGKWVIPGLIDAHVHFFQSGGIYTRPDILDLRSVRVLASGRRQTAIAIYRVEDGLIREVWFAAKPAQRER